MYVGSDGRQFRDLSTDRSFKTLGRYHPTNATDDNATFDAIYNKLKPETELIANHACLPGIREAALRDCIAASWEFHARGLWLPNLHQAARVQKEYYEHITRDILGAADYSPSLVNSHIGTIPEHLAMPVSMGGHGHPFFVVYDDDGKPSDLGPAFTIPAVEGFLTLAAALKTTPQVVEATIQLARLAGWKIPVQEVDVNGKPCGQILKSVLPPKAVGKKRVNR